MAKRTYGSYVPGEKAGEFKAHPEAYESDELTGVEKFVLGSVGVALVGGAVKLVASGSDDVANAVSTFRSGEMF